MSKKILIVDDNAAILEMLSEALTDSGYQTSSLSNAEKIFDRITDYQPNLILLDIMLGAADGRLICAAIKEQQAIPVIVISGNANNASSLFQTGAPDDFILKPFDLDHLLRRIELQLAA